MKFELKIEWNPTNEEILDWINMWQEDEELETFNSFEEIPENILNNWIERIIETYETITECGTFGKIKVIK